MFSATIAPGRAASFDQVCITASQSPVAFVSAREQFASLDRGHHCAGRFVHVFAILETARRGETVHFGKSQSLCVELFDRGRENADTGRVNE